MFRTTNILYSISVLLSRKIIKNNRSVSLEACEQLLQHPLHEARFTPLILLNEKFQKDPNEVLDVYLRNTKFINNWDLVDLSASHIVGGAFCLKTGNNDVILNLADKENLWDNRIAVVATLLLIKLGQFTLTFQLCERLFHHPHSLIHKACGWMLREISKRDAESVLRFSQRHCDVPSVTRVYALERIRKRKIDEIKSFDDFVYYANIPGSF